MCGEDGLPISGASSRVLSMDRDGIRYHFEESSCRMRIEGDWGWEMLHLIKKVGDSTLRTGDTPSSSKCCWGLGGRRAPTGDKEWPQERQRGKWTYSGKHLILNNQYERKPSSPPKTENPASIDSIGIGSKRWSSLVSHLLALSFMGSFLMMVKEASRRATTGGRSRPQPESTAQAATQQGPSRIAATTARSQAERRIQRLYKSSHTAKEMTWHATGKCTEPSKMQHPVAGRAWKDFDTKYLDFAAEPRNVRLGLAADGFNPFGNLSQSYNMWPVILTTYNLPSWLCMKESSFMLTLLIPGPKSPGKDIDVYLRPLIDDLRNLWAKPGVETIDVATCLKFNTRAMVL
ncbi:hypothetical protein Tco_0803714 [Tanacetum coccineum]|uniref:Uncharacterized protein n=1 Tax=Tanacetum coccineum TaxID=301880 RepID=A0ABQ5A4U8_9ASTR